MEDIGKPSIQSSEPSLSDEPEDDQQWQSHDQHGVDSKSGTPTADAHTGDQSNNNSVPMQKRRRVTRACDECRRKKIKCDGKQVNRASRLLVVISDRFSPVRIARCIAMVYASSEFDAAEPGH